MAEPRPQPPPIGHARVLSVNVGLPRPVDTGRRTVSYKINPGITRNCKGEST